MPKEAERTEDSQGQQTEASEDVEADEQSQNEGSGQAEGEEIFAGEDKNSFMEPAEDGASRSVVEEYTILTVGQELNQKEERYVFSCRAQDYDEIQGVLLS